ncbi:helix-turn-helix transcriptional regulator [Pyxidicoccus fallax]|uniref:Helix-turn-helix transcriptional regulator n=1 Tax=Pyxidicoccus fallax TaxID=394095 RepID=A0A848LG41_9BACT|nr:helix-turn-helix domain-containing protein [Pyxidicoccus fallax]NMO16085.1 helix-turn-helix transcriptional regulator [Pyxidicoccus fallax]NPC84150.1 helix-turn-helix transcriptional regulator [Pyxidicoccus fallax]
MALKVRKNRATPPADVVVRRRGEGPKAGEDCPLNRSMELLSGAWAPHVIYYLSAQPRRFGELRIDIAEVSARVLSQRLRELEARGVVSRAVVPTTPPSTEYALTELGRELVPVIQAIADVGRRLQNRPVERRSRPGPRSAAKPRLLEE